jgi:hypothetical protein
MKLFYFFVAVLFASASFAQTNPQEKLDSFSAQFITSIRTHERQRIILTTDKSVYIDGDAIWFKAFLINSISGKINNDSRFLYVDLVNDKDSVIKTVILDAANKQTDSKLLLPSTLPSGQYWLRGFTRQILETDSNNICVKPVYVINENDHAAIKRIITPASKPDTILQVKFYPEGGNIITGASSTVAVRITDSNGQPVQLKGLIRNNYDAVMGGFTTDNFGLGKFSFEASGHRQYRAVITYDGIQKDYPLPAFDFFKGQLSITKASPNYMVRVLLGDSIFRKNAQSFLVAIAKDKMVFASIGSGIYLVPVPESKLPDGIVTFYLFDKNFRLLSERSIYVENNNFNVALSTDKTHYTSHERALLNLSVTDSAEKPIPSLLAVSVFDSTFSNPDPCTQFPSEYSDKTIDNIFLASDNCLSDQQKDLLLMMKESNYESLSQMKESTPLMDKDSVLYLKGVVLNDHKEPQAQKVVTLISNSGSGIYETDTTDNHGRFRFPTDSYADSTQFGLQIRNMKGKPDKGTIILDPIVFPKVKTAGMLKEEIVLNNRKLRQYILRYYIPDTTDKHVLPAVYVKDKNAGDYDESKRVSSTSVILTANQINERNGVANAVLNVGGLHLLNGYLVVNGLTEINKAPDAGSEPMILLNGVPIVPSADIVETSPDLAYLNSFDPNSIDFIEIIKGSEGARYGLRGGNGVILINTLNKLRDVTSKGNGLFRFYAQGIAKPGLFPFFNYDQNDQTPTTFVEDRPTLYWNGNFFTDKKGNDISFYTSNIPSIYKVSVTGITVDGDFIYKTITFKNK